MKPVFSALLVLMLFMPASATIINVPADQPNIQAGINASSNDDTVRIATGTYVEKIDFSGKNIVVGSWFLDAGDPSYISSTIIDGNQSGSVVSFLNGEDNTAVITGFTIQNGLATYGGGIRCDNSNPTISYNTISGNSAGSRGGGIACEHSNATITYNTFSGNSANYGGGIYCFWSSLTISNNTISGNSANYGGGIYCWESDPTIINNTISGNSADTFGGGIACENIIMEIIITNTIFWENSAPYEPQIYLSMSLAEITYCDVQGGWEGEGNIDCDPMFCDPGMGDFYLHVASCCVGAGEGGVDIGAFGIGCSYPIVINIPADFETIQEGINASSHGDTVLVAPGTYVENIDFSGKNIVVGSWFLTTGDTSYISSTIIDGNQSGTVVSFLNDEDNTAVITGFTIQNGLASYGGGIYCAYSFPTITYNTVSGNTADWGGGIICGWSSATITYNTISGNSAYYGGGIFYWNSSNPTVNHNTISGNSAAEGGGIFCYDSSPPITNTIFWGDSAPIGPEICLYGTSSPVITYCDVQGGWAGETNIDCDPMFCYPDTGNYYLRSNSCCVGAGQGGVDIGAFGVGCASTYNIPADYETIQEGINASSHGDTVRVAPGTYVENIDFSGKNIVVGSWFLDAGDPSYISSTIIDGNQSGTVVTFWYGEDNTAIITGFTIQNGFDDYGGGIYCRDNSNPTINYNTISGNSAEYGGGIFCWDSSPTINYNTISGNSADGMGGGIYCYNSSSTISNNTITENTAAWDYGGGIFCYDSSPLITNTIFWADNPANEPEIYLEGTSSPEITYCDVQGGWEGEGNIDCNPMFCDPENGNFYLADASCCVGAGEGGVDIGAFGVGCHQYVINIPDNYETIQEGITASSHGDTVRVAPGTYVENIDFSGKNIVVGSWFLGGGDPSYISSTIIDGNAVGIVVRFASGETNEAKITGFTIQNGLAEYGGGIHCNNYSSPTINYNTISGNSASGGGGIFCDENSNPTINHNTISGNSADGMGGGIGCFDSSPVITNTIFWSDTAPDGPEIYLDASSPVITYCDVEGGWAGEGNIDCDPMFCDPENGNFYLDAASCCVGAGQGGVDIGAFGAGCHFPYTINIPADYETIQEGIDASFDGDTVRVAEGTYVENIDFSGKNIVVGSWFLDAGDPSYISSTIIDGNQSGSVVSFLNSEDNTAVITGLTIQNGDGGGILCQNSSPTISNNTICENSSNGGGGILCVNSDPPIINNTISGNSAGQIGGGGISCFDSSPVITNTIFWGDSGPCAPEICLYGTSSPVITYCDVEGGWEGDGNIDCDPMFCDPENGDFYLNAASCCVGAGEGGVDIGAFGVGCVPPIILSVVPSQNELNVLPNSDITVTFDIDMDESTINSTTFVVNGMTTGLHEGVISYDGPSRTATFDPVEDFAEGEIVTVVLTEGIESSEGIPLVAPFVWSFTTAVDGGTGIFAPYVSYPVNRLPYSVFASDLDGDGDLDLATVNVDSSNSSVLLNNGDGTFAPHADYPVGEEPWFVTAADLDGDGDIDLATANMYSEDVSVLLNDGDGTFAPQSTYPVGEGPVSVIASDLDGDGDIDLAAANLVSGTVSVLLNDGDGTFAPHSQYPAGDTPVEIYSADLDSDGDLDLATANYSFNNITVLMNNGDGTFAAYTPYDVGDTPLSVFAADLDADDDLDLIASNCYSQDISILLNDGDGNFALQATYSTGECPWSVKASDLDGDGDLDLVTSNEFSANVSVLLNNGDGTFAIRIDYAVGNMPYSVFAADLDGDGDMDLATASYGFDNVSVLLNKAACEYLAGDCNHNGVPLELGDVITMIGMYRGAIEPEYTCECPPHGDAFAPEADPNGNCVAFELGDVVTEIGAYRGTATASGCEDCPGSNRLGLGNEDQPVVSPTLKFKSKSGSVAR